MDPVTVLVAEPDSDLWEEGAENQEAHKPQDLVLRPEEVDRIHDLAKPSDVASLVVQRS